MGATRGVTVYRMGMKGSVEEAMLKLKEGHGDISEAASTAEQILKSAIIFFVLACS